MQPEFKDTNAAMESTPALSSIDDVISLIRPSVRQEHAYVVGAPSTQR